MCQGVIGVVVPSTREIHWGVGSHTDLIRRLFGSRVSSTAGDYLVRFECVLSDGPGEFTIEGGHCDESLRMCISDQLDKKIGTAEDLVAYVKQYGWDSAFTNALLPAAAGKLEKIDDDLEKLETAATGAYDEAYERAQNADGSIRLDEFRKDNKVDIDILAQTLEAIRSRKKSADNESLWDLLNRCESAANTLREAVEAAEDATDYNEIAEKDPKYLKAREAHMTAQLSATSRRIDLYGKLMADPKNRIPAWRLSEKREAPAAKKKVAKKTTKKKAARRK